MEREHVASQESLERSRGVQFQCNGGEFQISERSNGVKKQLKRDPTSSSIQLRIKNIELCPPESMIRNTGLGCEAHEFSIFEHMSSVRETSVVGEY